MPALPAIDVVATDLDGTFLGADGRVSALNAYAMRCAARRGVRLVFATGRPLRWLQPLQPFRPLDAYAIASNGAIVWSLARGEAVAVHPLPVDATVAVAAALLTAVPDAGFAVEYADGTWGRTPAYPIRGDMVEQSVLATEVASLLAADTAVKLLLVSPSRPTADLLAVARPAVRERLSLTYSMVRSAGLLEMCGPGVDKGTALRDLLAAWEVRPERVAAFGDMPNDLPLLHAAGFPFAMSDADPSLLGAGFPLAGDHDDSGVGRRVLELLGEPLPDDILRDTTEPR
ncbi:MAG: Cof-type HAD-IIB family hydrolase [Actinomycetia bacterium]|nr:Cof-type HAD-IIB family hydrolase [Actinomycetes bacterium]